jgi:enamine deaminase RidA (YjgF/YER057c/UK114 family)
MHVLRLVVALGIAVLLVAEPGWSAKKKKKKKADQEPITQVLELPKDPPAAVKVETARLSFQVAPLISKGLLSQQVRESLKTLIRLEKGAQVVKLRAFVAGTGDMRRVPMLVSEVFSERHLPLPAVSVVQVGGLPMEGAQVAIEAVSMEKKPVNPEGLAFISGQQFTGKDPMAGVAPLVVQSVGGLKKAVDAAGVTPDAVLRVTCFLTSLEDVTQSRQAVAGAFPAAVLNLVQVQRAPVEGLSECEAVARLSKAPAQQIEFLNPEGMAKSPAYSQVALVNAPRLAITGTQLAFRAQDSDVRLAFQRLGRVLEQVNSNYGSVAVAHYYPLTRSITEQVRKFRFEFLNKDRPPASTLLLFEALPSLDATFGIDVIAAAGP